MYDDLVKRLMESARERCYIGCFGICRDCKIEDLLQEAAEAIEKRDKPMEIKEIHVDEYYCPACGAENNADEGVVYDRYCPECGQRLLAPEKEE